MQVYLPFNLIIKVCLSSVDAEDIVNYISISLFKLVPIQISVRVIDDVVYTTIVDTGKMKLIQVFNIGFRYRKTRILVRL